MEYKKYDYENYSVHFLKTTDFKSIFVSLFLINDFNKENLTKNFLLRKLLTFSSKNLKDEQEVIRKVYELYNAGIFISNDICNNVITTSFEIEILEDKYTEDGLTKRALEYFFDTIFNPNIIDGKFEKNNYELALKAVNNYYDRLKENKSSYAISRAYSKMDYEYLKYGINGDRQQLKNIDRENMVTYYNDLFKTANANIFVIGSFDDEEMLTIINNNLKNRLYKNPNNYKEVVFSENNSIIDEEDIEKNNQSILVMIYKILNITERERNVVLPIFNRILGVGNNSKLFKNVREKNSLCYDIRSTFLRGESILDVKAGISYENKDRAVELIKEEIYNMKQGNITDNEIDEAKKFRMKSLKQFEDENDSILYIKESSILFNNDDLQKRKDEVDTVTKNEIVDLANKLDLNIIYMLKGDNNE